MLTVIKWEVDDDTRARIRSHNGRYGRATRKEIVAFALEELVERVKKLPPAKFRTVREATLDSIEGRRSEADRAADVAAFLAPARERFGLTGEPAAAAVTDETICRVCRYRRGEHVGAGTGVRRLSCPLSRDVKPGATFDPVEDFGPVQVSRTAAEAQS